MALAAAIGLVAAGASTWVHHQVLHRPGLCQLLRRQLEPELHQRLHQPLRFGCRHLGGAARGDVLRRHPAAARLRRHRSPRPRAASPATSSLAAIVGLAGVFYLGYASFVVLKNVCLLCVATYVAVIGLFVSAAVATRIPMRTLPGRLAGDLSTTAAHPGGCGCRRRVRRPRRRCIALVPGRAGRSRRVRQAATPAPSGPRRPPREQELEQFLAAQQRVPVMVATEGAAVVLVKFNDYQCPPCGQTFSMYKPVLAKYNSSIPARSSTSPRTTRWIPSATGWPRPAPTWPPAKRRCRCGWPARRARPTRWRTWLFANQPTLTPAASRKPPASSAAWPTSTPATPRC